MHGDYRLDNVIFHASEPRILAVLDWELSTLGHPLADFSYHCMYWRLSPGGVSRHRRPRSAGARHPDRGRVRGGVLRAHRPRRIENWDYYVAYNMFRLAAICQGIMGRVVDGTAASQQAIESGKRARPAGRSRLAASREDSVERQLTADDKQDT